MSKIIRLTESDLTRLVKTIVEQHRIDDHSDQYFMAIDEVANYAMNDAFGEEDIEAAIDEISEIMPFPLNHWLASMFHLTKRKNSHS